MEELRLKKAIFYSDRIVFLQKKEDIIIEIKDIHSIEYKFETFWNYFCLAIHSFLAPDVYMKYPGRLYVYTDILSRGKLRHCRFSVRIRRKDIWKLPEVYRTMLFGEY
jgi:hypothetical protein